MNMGHPAEPLAMTDQGQAIIFRLHTSLPDCFLK